MIYRIELRERDMNFVSNLDDRVTNLKWGFSPVGGCGNFSFEASSRYCTELDLGANFNFRLYLRNHVTKTFDLVYQGRIENLNNSVEDPEKIVVQGFGYQSQLRDIVINVSYTSTEVSVIVKAILDNYVVPNTDLTYTLSDLEATGVTLDSIDFQYVTAQEALEKLATIVGNREWGVDKNRSVYFKQRSTSTGFRYSLGSKKVEKFKVGSSSRELVNRVIVIGGMSGGSKFVYTKDYAQNQLKYKRRDRVIQNAGVTTNAVAQQLADSFQAEHDMPVNRGEIVLRDSLIFETTIPLGLLEVATREIVYDEKEYDTFLYAGQDPFRIVDIDYELDEELNLVSKLNLGAALPDIVESIKQLEFEIEQTVQRG